MYGSRSLSRCQESKQPWGGLARRLLLAVRGLGAAADGLGERRVLHRELLVDAAVEGHRGARIGLDHVFAEQLRRHDVVAARGG